MYIFYIMIQVKGNLKAQGIIMNWIARSPATANVSPGHPKSVYMGQQNS